MIDRIDNNDGGDADGDGDPHAVQESQIRKMTRLAIEYQAVNLSQGVYMCVCVCVCMCVCVFSARIGQRFGSILSECSTSTCC
jgi:hypothetical protein